MNTVWTLVMLWSMGGNPVSTVVPNFTTLEECQRSGTNIIVGLRQNYPPRILVNRCEMVTK